MRLWRNTDRDGQPQVALSRPFLLTVSVSFLIALGISIVVPAITLVVDAYELTRANGGLFLSSFAVGRITFSLWAGILGDRFGFRRIALVGCAVIAVSSVVGAFTPSSYAVLLLVRFVQGGGASLYQTVALAYVLGLAPRGSVGRLLATYQGFQIAAMSTGPAIGGLVSAIWGIPGPFILYAVFGLIGLIVAGRFLPERVQPLSSTAQTHGKKWSAVRPLLGDLAFLLALVASLTLALVKAGVNNTLLPLFAVEELGFSQGLVGLMLTAIAVGQLGILPMAGSSVDRLGRVTTLRLGLFLSVPLLTLLAMGASPWILFIAAIGLGAVKGLGSVVPTVVISDLVGTSKEIRGTAIGIQRTIADVGTVVGPVVAGVLVDEFSYGAAYVVAAVFMLIIALLMAYLRETGNPSLRLDKR